MPSCAEGVLVVDAGTGVGWIIGRVAGAGQTLACALLHDPPPAQCCQPPASSLRPRPVGAIFADPPGTSPARYLPSYDNYWDFAPSSGGGGRRSERPSSFACAGCRSKSCRCPASRSPVRTGFHRAGQPGADAICCGRRSIRQRQRGALPGTTTAIWAARWRRIPRRLTCGSAKPDALLPASARHAGKLRRRAGHRRIWNYSAPAARGKRCGLPPAKEPPGEGDRPSECTTLRRYQPVRDLMPGQGAQ